MKKIHHLRLSALALALLMALSAVACQPSEGPIDTTVETTGAAEPGTTAGNDTTAADTTEAVTEEETLRELTWETYDPALDNSTVNKQDPHEVDASQWVAEDGLDRVLSTNTQTGDKREDKIVAMFYWTWHGTFANNQTAYNNQQNINALLNNGRTEQDYFSMSIAELKKLGAYTMKGSGANGPYHFWNEPIYGYYDGDDEWVIRKQAELLASAGVDVVFFDNTNGNITWMDTAKKVMKVFSEARAQGVDAPDVSFMLPFAGSGDARSQLVSLYQEIYQPGYCSDVWFELDGKPMIMAHRSALNTSDELQRTIADFFTFRANMPDYLTKETNRNQWGWLSRFPQAYYRDEEGNVEQISVGVGINHDYQNSVIAPMSLGLGQSVINRTWTSRGYDSRENAVFYGACLAEQWENALAVDPEVVFVTGWNEWVAMRIGNWPAAVGYKDCFVDQYSDLASRDIEPTKGALKDYYYYQLVDYVRQFKGTNEIPAASEEKLIKVDGGYGQFADVGPTYNDYFGLPDRNAQGYKDPVTKKRPQYKNDSGRNDFYDAKVARDYENLYFMVRTVEDITPYTDAYWMRLYLDMGASEQNWENYEYILNKQSPDDATTATLERFTGNGFETEVVGKVTYSVQGNVMIVCIPKAMIGLGDKLDFDFGFKWADNTLEDGEIMDWYVNGDTAPVGRFNYCYSTTGSAEYEDDGRDGSAIFDLRVEDMRNEVKTYLVDDRTACVNYEFTAEGLKLTTTAAAAGFILDYSKASPAVALDNYESLKITYRTTGNTAIRPAIDATGVLGTLERNAKSKDAVAEGESLTVTVALKQYRVTEGYLKLMGLYFEEDAAVGSSVVIEKIEFIRGE